MNRGNDTFNEVTGGHFNGPLIQARDVRWDINLTAPRRTAFKSRWPRPCVRSAERKRRNYRISKNTVSA
ncbi:hypothetical protein AB0G74_16160 [Streptomyces sp. NPDC020875]|uniref:hypothetical protein n=1 Tax=Streptomyces sp. NPDC020875 TaxID=3154898 RepID=UPI0033C4BFEC